MAPSRPDRQRRPGNERRHLQSPLTASQERRGSRVSGVFRLELPLFARGRTGSLRLIHPLTAPDKFSAMRPIVFILIQIITLYMYLLIASAILSWLIAFNVVNTRNQLVAGIGEFLYRITEPALRPIRRWVPIFGGLDISPIILFFFLWMIQMYLTDYVYPNVP
jgi:YggT family protein